MEGSPSSCRVMPPQRHEPLRGVLESIWCKPSSRPLQYCGYADRVKPQRCSSDMLMEMFCRANRIHSEFVINGGNLSAKSIDGYNPISSAHLAFSLVVAAARGLLRQIRQVFHQYFEITVTKSTRILLDISCQSAPDFTVNIHF